MKKTIIILMVVCLLASVVSCGKKPDDEKPKVTENATSQNTESPEKETPKQAEETEKPAIELNNIEHIQSMTKGNLKSLYLDYSTARYTVSVGSRTLVFHRSGFNFIVLQYYDERTFDDNKSFEGTFREVFDQLNNGRPFFDIQGYTFGKSFGEDIKIIPSLREVTKINGVEAECIEGIASDDKTYVYGYSFIFNDIPCMLLGMIVDIDEHQDLVELQKQEIDLMVQTIRVNPFDD